MDEKTLINSVNYIMAELNNDDIYLEMTQEELRSSIKKYIKEAYDAEVANLSLKIDVEKSRGLFNADSIERFTSEAKWINYRIKNKIKALSLNGKNGKISIENNDLKNLK